MDTNGRAPAEEFKITEYVHRFLESRIRPGDLCIDATMGNGADTEFLCKCSGAGQKGGGNVLAFDIQPDALEHTQKRLAEAGYSGCARLILDSHENMDRYVKPQSVKAVTFNLGYLPGGDHSIATRAESTVRAAEKSLQLLVFKYSHLQREGQRVRREGCCTEMGKRAGYTQVSGDPYRLSESARRSADTSVYPEDAGMRKQEAGYYIMGIRRIKAGTGRGEK